MAATGYTPISLYYSATASAVPLAANLVAGELALNTNDGKLYYKNSSNVVTQLAGAGGPAGGSSGQVQYNSSGVLAGSANLLFSGTDLTVYGLTVGRGAGAVAGNTAVGASALAANTSGAFNTSVGATTLAGNTTGVRNTGVGYAALFLGTTASYNSGFGFGTLNTNTGDNNTAIGYYSMGLNTSGASNSALGFQALYSNTTASNNTAVGYQAFYSNTTGGNQIGLGYQAGYNSAGSQNLAIGYQALYNNTGANIYAIGYQALYSNTGNDNYAFGFLSLNANTSGGNSVAMGLYTLRYNTTGSNHSAFGDRALTANTTGTFNSAFGSGTLSANTTGNYNVGLGMYALSSNTTASNSTGVGYQAGSLATGAGNQLFGYSSGSSITTGAKNVIIGSYTGSAAPISATGSNYIVLSDGDGNVRAHWNSANATFGGTLSVTGLTSTGAIATSNVAAAVTSFSATCVAGDQTATSLKLASSRTDVFYHIQAFTSGTTEQFRVEANGNVKNTNNSYGALSDVKLKENIVDASPKLANLMQVKVRNYNLIGETTKQIGVVAQELETVFPSMVDESNDRDVDGNILETTTKGVKYSVFVPMLIKAIQEQQAIIESLKARLDAANL
jgi:hypothetical protein